MKVFLAGHRGMVGSALERRLAVEGIGTITRERARLDLADQSAVRGYLRAERPDAVVVAAARVGGIHANATYPAEFLYQNLMIEANLIHQAHEAGIQRLLFLGSSCIYPRLAPQPMSEEALLTGPLEPTNEPYGIAKIVGIKLCESYNSQYGTDYRCVMPTNLYGPADNFHPENSHVLPAPLRRFHEAATVGASEVTIWGTGAPFREFLYVDDLADACLFVLGLDPENYRAWTAPTRGFLNVGTGSEISIAELARMIADETGFAGRIMFDPKRPDGAPRKLLDISRMTALGWTARTTLADGLARTYAWYCDHGAQRVRH